MYAGVKNPFWRRRGFWEWRRREITYQNRRMRARKHIFPLAGVRYLPENHQASPFEGKEEKVCAEDSHQGGADPARAAETAGRHLLPHWHGRGASRNTFFYPEDAHEEYFEDLRYLKPPKKGEGRVWTARKADVAIGRKKLLLLLRLIKGLQLTDALDWLQALALHRCNVLINLLSKEQQRIRDSGADPARVYIQSYLIGRAGHVKTMQVGTADTRGERVCSGRAKGRFLQGVAIAGSVSLPRVFSALVPPLRRSTAAGTASPRVLP